MNYLFNAGPAETITASKANGKNIYIKDEKLLDLSYAAGSLLLGHTSKVYKKSLSDLEQMLDEAIRNEDYERASLLRDEINKKKANSSSSRLNIQQSNAANTEINR